MQATIEQAMQHGVAVGAHPGYEDRENFGRLELQLTPEEIRNSVYRQLITLALVAGKCGARVVHVKPHGALYNQAAKDAAIARAIATGVRLCTKDVVMVGLAGLGVVERVSPPGFFLGAGAVAAP